MLELNQIRQWESTGKYFITFKFKSFNCYIRYLDSGNIEFYHKSTVYDNSKLIEGEHD
jgi:hypothetical protein